MNTSSRRSSPVQLHDLSACVPEREDFASCGRVVEGRHRHVLCHRAHERTHQRTTSISRTKLNCIDLIEAESSTPLHVGFLTILRSQRGIKKPTCSTTTASNLSNAVSKSRHFVCRILIWALKTNLQKLNSECKVKASSPARNDMESAAKLWTFSEQLVASAEPSAPNHHQPFN